VLVRREAARRTEAERRRREILGEAAVDEVAVRVRPRIDADRKKERKKD